jgi:predicted nucleic acid-binding protein
LPFTLQKGETEALALALQLPASFLLVDDAQGRKAAAALGLGYTGTLGILLRATFERKIPKLRPVLELLKKRTTFWLRAAVYEAALKQVGEKA